MKRLSIFGAAVLLALAGCGSSSSSSTSTGSSGGGGASTAPSSGSGGGGGGQTVSLQADKSQLKFNTTTLSAKSGKVTIVMTNPSPLQHDIAIKGAVNAKGSIVGQGGKSTLNVTLKPGKYTFYCSVDGHEAAGMKGELTVS